MSTTALPSSTPSLAAFFGLDPTALLSREDAAMRKAHLYSKNAVKDRKPIHSPWIPKNLLTNLALESATSLLTVLKEVTDENPARFAVDASARPQAAVDLLNFSALWRHVLRNSYKPLIKDVTIEQSQRILELVASKTLLKNEQEMQIRITRDTWNAASDVSTARAALLPPGASFTERLQARFDAARYFMLQVGLYPAVIKNMSHVLWDLGEMILHQVAVSRARRKAREALAEEPDQDSTFAIQARIKMSKLNAKSLSFQAMVERAFLIVQWGVMSTLAQTVGGGVGTFLLPGLGTFVGETGASIFLHKPVDDIEWDDMSATAGF